MSQSSPKFRPYLTLEQMERIVFLCQVEQQCSTILNYDPLLDKSIEDALQLMILKARNNITKPSFIPLAAKLGIPDPSFIPEQSQEEKLEEARYTSGQMTPEEAAAYESKLMERINHGI